MVVMEGERTWYEGSAGAPQHPNSPLPAGAAQHHQEGAGGAGADADSYFKGSSAASQYFSQAAAMQSAYGGMTHGKTYDSLVHLPMRGKRSPRMVNVAPAW